MTYVTITTWEVPEGVAQEVSLRNLREKRLPALKKLGATRITVIRTSPRTTAAISEWPDQRTRDEAYQMIALVREKLRSDDGSRMTGELLGEVIAEV